MQQQGADVAELHIRASQWYEENGLEIEAFHHAVAANDVDRAARLVEGGGAPHGSPSAGWVRLPCSTSVRHPSSVAAGHPDHLQTLAKPALESAEFAVSTLHMLVFCIGAILFYTLLTKSTVIPRAMSLWGLVTVFPMLVGTLLLMLGADAPLFLHVPYVPFEFVVGAWILIKGIQGDKR